MMMTEAEILTRIDRLTEDRLSLCVAQSWVRPRQSEKGPAYDAADLARLQLIVELSEDMEVNDAALPLILNLIDEVSSLRGHMRALNRALEAEGPDICTHLVERLAAAEKGPSA